MANLSSAFGEITFKNKDKDDLARFIYYFNKTNTIAEYSTYLNDIYNLSSYDDVQVFVKEHAILNDSLEYEIKRSFIGAGRWCYTENLDWFFNFEDYKNNIPNYTELMLGTKIDVHFIDEEGGCNELYEYSASLHAKASKYDFKTCIENEEKTKYDYTVENLKKLCDYTDIYSIEDAIKHPEDYFREEVLLEYKDTILNALKKDASPQVLYDIYEFKDMAKLENILPDVKNIYLW